MISIDGQYAAVQNAIRAISALFLPYNCALALQAHDTATLDGATSLHSKVRFLLGRHRASAKVVSPKWLRKQIRCE